MRARSKEKKEKKLNKNNVLFSLALVLLVMLSVIPAYKAAADNYELHRQYESLQDELKEQQNYKKELEDSIKYSDRDEYVEKIAREKLNMIKSDEIVFVDKNK